MNDIISFDAELGKNLQELHALVCRKKFIESTDGYDSEAISELRFHGARIEDLCLDFTLPGFPDYVLKSGEDNVMMSFVMTILSTKFLVVGIQTLNLIVLNRLIYITWRSMYHW